MARSTNDRLMSPRRRRMRAKRYVVVSARSVPSTSTKAAEGGESYTGQTFDAKVRSVKGFRAILARSR
jgi:hypothetical protein